MLYCLTELAYHKDIQEKLRDEINEVVKKYDGKITYEALSEMHYLDQVINGLFHSLILENLSSIEFHF